MKVLNLVILLTLFSGSITYPLKKKTHITRMLRKKRKERYRFQERGQRVQREREIQQTRQTGCSPQTLNTLVSLSGYAIQGIAIILAAVLKSVLD